ncbi:hypothetical protein F4781DRAFT_435330 [Annulohypoxylon bovei var. microspora]|nr:hypothetical protein F4781DRAFT_435330 [Annulohypoxylon bovei var. microspora]
MSQNQTPWPGDKIPNLPKHAPSQSERSQLQSYVIPPSNSPMPPPLNPSRDQAVVSYGANPTSTSMAPQYTAAPSTYSSAPSAPTSQYPTSMSMPPRSTPMAPHMYSNYTGWSNTMGIPDLSAPMNPTFTYSHQQNTHIIPNTAASQPNQWPPEQPNEANSRLYAPLNNGSTTLENSEPIPQSQVISTNQYTMFTSIGSPTQVTGNIAGPSTPIGSNGYSPNFDGDISSPLRAGTQPNSGESSNSNANDYQRTSKSRDKAPFKWKPGMKERKITDEMTPEEKKEAGDWNYKYSEAKKAHTREQNRVSAQKSRQKKVELLEKTKTQVELLEEENARLQHHIAGMDAMVQQTSNENMHLRNQNEILRQRVVLLQQQIQAQQIQNPHIALPELGNQSHSQSHTPTLTPGQAQAQHFMQAPTPAPRQNPTPNQNAPQTQADFEYALGTTQTAQVPTGNAPVGINQQPQQPQQLDNGAQESQDDFIVDWMQGPMGDFPPDSGSNSRPWSPPNGGV